MSEVPCIFDSAALRARRRRTLRLPEAGFLAAHLAAEAADRLGAVLRHFPLALDLGTPGNALADALRAYPRVGAVIRMEGEPLALRGERLAVAADPEALPFGDGTLDLVVSLLALSAVNDLPGVLVQIRRALLPDGFFLAAVLGEGTLSELRAAFSQAELEIEGGVSPRVAPFADVRTLGALLQRAGFALPVVDADRLVVRYADPLKLLQDLRAEAMTNSLADRRRVPLRRATLLRALEIYARSFADADGRVRATFEFVWMSGWAPDPSQQQPLRPGSARTRLADALGTSETPLGRD